MSPWRGGRMHCCSTCCSWTILACNVTQIAYRKISMCFFKYQIVYLYAPQDPQWAMEGWNLGNWLSGKSLKLLPPDTRFKATWRPVSADRTARRKFQATGQPVSRTQASDAMRSRLPRYEAKCVQRRCFQWGSVPLRSDIKGKELPPANILIPL